MKFALILLFAVLAVASAQRTRPELYMALATMTNISLPSVEPMSDATIGNREPDVAGEETIRKLRCLEYPLEKLKLDCIPENVMDKHLYTDKNFVDLKNEDKLETRLTEC
ncbi:hypothetical protein TNIN_495921 [Trichonephila inaurata madagascariensis]|uniref:Uncharacterized protein n=1 Tax=Trichonephila inaurata madagascariensis TaxID=2747483 RepID=A0A8X6YKI2_9ARAC|nr:hypothetical protein TNIN_495921 [Trichonephila inaurata madagascariensis]